MAGRKGQLTVDQQVELGTAVVIGRGSGMSWKQLCRVYGRSQPTLWRYAQTAKMNNNKLKMNNLEGCATT